MIVLGSGHTLQGEINGAEKIRPSFTKLHCKEVWPSDRVLTCEKCHVVIMAPCVEWRFSRVCCFSLCPRTWRFNWGNIVILSYVALAVAQPSLSNLVCIALSKERRPWGEMRGALLQILGILCLFIKYLHCLQGNIELRRTTNSECFCLKYSYLERESDTLGGLWEMDINIKLLTNIITGGWCQTHTNTNENFISERNSEEFLISCGRK